MSEKDLRVIKTKQSIYNALLECMNKYPIKKITVHKITEHAQINRSTFYKYYVDKFDLIDTYIKEVLDNFVKNINADFIKASNNEIYDSIYHDYFKNILKFFSDNSKAYKILWNANIEKDIFIEMLNVLQENILNIIYTDTTFNKSKNNYAKLYSHLFASNCMTTIKWWLESAPEMSIDDVGVLMKSNMENGFFQTYRLIIDDKLLSK
jgi:AcrR family transcriptional regulator